MEDKRAFFGHHARSRRLAEFSAEERAKALKLIERFELAPHHVVLEVGSGTGRLTTLLSPHVREGWIVSLDFSSRMLARSQQRRHAENVVLVQADASRIPLRDECVDRALMFCVYPHLPEPLQALVDVHRVLRTGGKLFIAHLAGSREINELHRRTGGAVGGDVLPPAAHLARLLDAQDFRVETAIDEPSGYFVAASR